MSAARLHSHGKIPFVMHTCKITCVALLMLSTLGIAQSGAPSSSALINEALDKQTAIDLDTTLPQALKRIESDTGVPLRASKLVYDTLPWGEQTKLTAKIEGKTLRESLSLITARLGLRYTVADEAVEIEPVPALLRVGRRATLDELTLLDALRTASFPNTADARPVSDVVKQVEQSFTTTKSAYTIENRAGDELSRTSVRLGREATLFDALEELHAQSRATWYPWGKSIVIVPKEELVRTLLERPITMRWSGVDVSQVLTELARRSGVAFTIEPGAVQRIAPESRTIRLVLENVSTRQALDSIGGFTGLGYVLNENGVYIWNPTNSPVRRPGRPVTIYDVDGMQVLLSDDELPPDVKEYLQSRRQKAINELRERMKKEGFKPTTQPDL